MKDLAHLAQLDRTHVLISARLGVSLDLRGGVLMKLRFWGGRVALAFLHPGADVQLAASLRDFTAGREIDGADRAAQMFDSDAPTIEPGDWNRVTNDDGVIQVGALEMRNALGVELSLGSGRALAMLMAPSVAARLAAALRAAGVPDDPNKPRRSPGPAGHA